MEFILVLASPAFSAVPDAKFKLFAIATWVCTLTTDQCLPRVGNQQMRMMVNG